MMPKKYTPIQKAFSGLCNERKFNYPCDCADLAVRVSGTIIQCRHTAYNNITMQDAWVASLMVLTLTAVKESLRC